LRNNQELSKVAETYIYAAYTDPGIFSVPKKSRLLKAQNEPQKTDSSASMYDVKPLTREYLYEPTNAFERANGFHSWHSVVVGMSVRTNFTTAGGYLWALSIR